MKTNKTENFCMFISLSVISENEFQKDTLILTSSVVIEKVSGLA